MKNFRFQSDQQMDHLKFPSISCPMPEIGR